MTNTTASLAQLFAAIKDENWQAVKDWSIANELHLGSEHSLAEAMTGTDSLTGLLNRAGFEARAMSMAQLAHRERRKLFLSLLDLDGLKQVNDSLGHEAGDAVLIDFACKLRKSVRQSDCVARLGGDEFLVLQAEDGTLTTRLATEACSSMGTAMLEFDTQQNWSEASARLAIAEALAEADKRMYKDKRKRRAAALLQEQATA